LGSHAAEFGEGFLVLDAFGVVPGGDEELAGEFNTDAEEFDKVRRGGANDGLDVLVELSFISASSAFHLRARSRRAVLMLAISRRSGSACS
jgi:hypothetical protein